MAEMEEMRNLVTKMVQESVRQKEDINRLIEALAEERRPADGLAPIDSSSGIAVNVFEGGRQDYGGKCDKCSRSECEYSQLQ